MFQKLLMMFLDLSTFERSASVGNLQRRATKNIVYSFGLVTVVSISYLRLEEAFTFI